MKSLLKKSCKEDDKHYLLECYKKGTNFDKILKLCIKYKSINSQKYLMAHIKDKDISLNILVSNWETIKEFNVPNDLLMNLFARCNNIEDKLKILDIKIDQKQDIKDELITDLLENNLSEVDKYKLLKICILSRKNNLWHNIKLTKERHRIRVFEWSLNKNIEYSKWMIENYSWIEMEKAWLNILRTNNHNFLELMNKDHFYKMVLCWDKEIIKNLSKNRFYEPPEWFQKSLTGDYSSFEEGALFSLCSNKYERLDTLEKVIKDKLYININYSNFSI